jgi:hypothetical protein
MIAFRSALLLIASLSLLTLAPISAQAAPINQIPYASVGPNLVDFEDVAALPFPGVVYNGILVSGGAKLAERFVGQTLSFSGNSDVLSGIPTGPLTLQIGAANQNLDVGIENGTHNLLGCGPRGCLDANGYGEGSFAILFPGLVSEFGYQGLFGDSFSLNTTVDFFASDGSLIASITVAGQGDFGFQREGGVHDIAGVSIYTLDLGGLAYDNIKFDEPQGPGPQPTPEPMTLLLLGTGLAGLVLLTRERRKREQA